MALNPEIAKTRGTSPDSLNSLLEGYFVKKKETADYQLFSRKVSDGNYQFMIRLTPAGGRTLDQCLDALRAYIDANVSYSDNDAPNVHFAGKGFDKLTKNHFTLDVAGENDAIVRQLDAVSYEAIIHFLSTSGTINGGIDACMTAVATALNISWENLE